MNWRRQEEDAEGEEGEEGVGGCRVRRGDGRRGRRGDRGVRTVNGWIEEWDGQLGSWGNHFTKDGRKRDGAFRIEAGNIALRRIPLPLG